MIAILSGNTYSIIESGRLGITGFDYLKNIYVSLLPIFTFFVASKKGHIGEKELRIWTFVLLLIVILCFYRNQKEAIVLMQESGIKREEITNNGAYGVLSILCLLPLFNKKLFLQYSLLALCMFYVIVGMKRGALVCGIVITLWFLFNSIRNERNRRRSFVLILLTCGIVFGAFYAVDYMLGNSEYFNQRLESTLAGESSNRDVLYSTLYRYLFVSSPIHFLFGNGANATLGIASNYAHNDWLEIAINNGLFVVIIYFIYWVRMFKTIVYSKKNYVCYMMISIFFIFSFLRTFFSMSYADVPLSASLAFGFALANYNHSDFTQCS